MNAVLIRMLESSLQFGTPISNELLAQIIAALKAKS